MAAFAVIDHITDVGNLKEVMAALETYIETLDDTTNVLYFVDVKQLAGDTFVGAVLHKG